MEALNGMTDDCKVGAKLQSDDMLTIDKLNKNQNIFMGWYNMLCLSMITATSIVYCMGERKQYRM